MKTSNSTNNSLRNNIKADIEALKKSELIEMVCDLVERKNSMEERAEYLEAVNSQNEQYITDWSNKCTELEEELYITVEDYKKTVADLELIVDRESEQIKVLKGRIDAMNKDIKGICDNNSALDTSVNFYKNELKEVNMNVQYYQSLCKDKDSEIVGLKAQLDAEKFENDRMREEIISLNNKISFKNDEMSGLQTAIEISNSIIKDWEEIYNYDMQEINKCDDEIAALNEKYNILNEKYNKLVIDNNELQCKANVLNIKCESAVDDKLEAELEASSHKCVARSMVFATVSMGVLALASFTALIVYMLL